EQIPFGTGEADVYSVPVTLWAFLSQVASASKSCLTAVSRVLVLLAILGRRPCHAGRYYCSYWLIALAQARGVHVVFRQHQLRHTDFRRGRRLGRDDHVVTWNKPPRPKWMDEDT